MRGLTDVVRQGSLCTLLALASLLAACDVKNISELEEGVSTEADVRERFGTPEAVWEGEDGAQIYEYNRQPAGHVNYMITIGPDGRMAALRQVLTERNFAQVKPGMAMEDVRRMLGKPMKITTYALKRETHYDWRYLQGPNQSDSKVFTVVFDPDLRVINTMSGPDPDLERNR
ncbi:outer membrane protein assembly factor BamE [Hydrogenophaga sp.]|uniref:outer membrane protein assembly factor BamE domain-containing protein n=1 Tax=Hydrogenophaga sp. TaxID=1904254 RepID=UPI0025C00A25|nr:outer membrane protein assembly factor BamE [Hydrogenophaga sp.]MBT9467277.1 outer membrane protein assembly factor BamE [Hydrogenophaga sp.]